MYARRLGCGILIGMETRHPHQGATRRRGGQPAKLNDQRVEAFLRRHADLGSSISEIRDALALAEPEGLALEVGRATVARRLASLGIKTKGISIMQAAKLSDDAISLSTRPLAPGEVRQSARRGQARVPSWLSPYKTEIGRMIGEGMVYREIWDALAAANPMEPRFAQELSDHAKSSRIADFKYREAQKAQRRRGRKAALLQTFAEPQSQSPTFTPRSAPGQSNTRATNIDSASQFLPEVAKTRANPQSWERGQESYYELKSKREAHRPPADPEKLALAQRNGGLK